MKDNNSSKLLLNDEVSIKITSLSAEGDGIGSFEGLKVFIPGALPEEIVKARIKELKPRYARAELLQVLNKSKDRIQPICPIFGACGGCQLLHLSYAKQLEAKRNRVLEALRRIGHLEGVSVAECVPSPQKLAYRNKIQLPVVFDGLKTRVGLFRRDSHEVIELERCYIQCDRGERILNWLKPRLSAFRSFRYLLIRNGINSHEALLVFVTHGGESEKLKKLAEELIREFPEIVGVIENINTSNNNAILGPHFSTLMGLNFFHESLLNHTFRISAPSFFQVNSFQSPHLFAKALELADIKPTDRVLDAYAGVGVLASRQAHEVVGIEIASSSIADAKVNADLNTIVNAEFFVGKAEELIFELPAFDLIFLNPPRKGCEIEVLRALIQRPPKRVIYVSCDPATLARDLHFLSSAFHVEEAFPFDMFPQTMHVETVVSCTRK